MKLDVLEVQNTHTERCGVTDCMAGKECEMWEGMEREVAWRGVHEKSRTRGKEACAFLIFPRLGYGKKRSKIVWAVSKSESLSVNGYNVGNAKEREDMRNLWNDVNEYLWKFAKWNRIVLTGKMNERVGSNEISAVVWK